MGAPFVLQTMEYLAGRFFRSERSLVIDGDKHVGIIDPGFSSSSVSEVLQHCRSYGKSVTHVVLSHAHNDHVANIDDYADAFPSLKIIVSQNSPFAVRDETIVCDDGESMRIADVDCCFYTRPGIVDEAMTYQFMFRMIGFFFAAILHNRMGIVLNMRHLHLQSHFIIWVMSICDRLTGCRV